MALMTPTRDSPGRQERRDSLLEVIKREKMEAKKKNILFIFLSMTAFFFFLPEQLTPQFFSSRSKL